MQLSISNKNDVLARPTRCFVHGSNVYKSTSISVVELQGSGGGGGGGGYSAIFLSVSIQIESQVDLDFGLSPAFIGKFNPK